MSTLLHWEMKLLPRQTDGPRLPAHSLAEGVGVAGPAHPPAGFLSSLLTPPQGEPGSRPPALPRPGCLHQNRVASHVGFAPLTAERSPLPSSQDAFTESRPGPHTPWKPESSSWGGSSLGLGTHRRPGSTSALTSN